MHFDRVSCCFVQEDQSADQCAGMPLFVRCLRGPNGQAACISGRFAAAQDSAANPLGPIAAVFGGVVPRWNELMQ